MWACLSLRDVVAVLVAVLDARGARRSLLEALRGRLSTVEHLRFPSLFHNSHVVLVRLAHLRIGYELIEKRM